MTEAGRKWTPEERMKTEMKPAGELYEKGALLLKAAKDYWDEYQKTGDRKAVVWLQGDLGDLVVYTRSEYREDLKQFIGTFD